MITLVTWIFLKKEKSEVGQIFKNFDTMIQTQFKKKKKNTSVEN